MGTHIFIRSFAKDFPWLAYALRSIQKFCTGFTGVTVAIPAHDTNLAFLTFSKVPNVTFSFYPCPDKPMLRGEVQLCRCDEIVPPGTTHVLLTDSDCIFHNMTRPEDYTINHKPIMIGERFDSMPPGSGCFHWRDATKNALGFVPMFEFMTRHPALYPVWIFPMFRKAVETHTGRKFDEYVLSGRNEWPQEFAELTSLGAYAHKEHSQQFEIMIKGEDSKYKLMADSGNPSTLEHLKAFWSHAGVGPHKEEIERILA